MTLVLRAFAVVSLVFAILAGRAERAEACTCGDEGLELPPPGALDVPTNLAEVLVVGSSMSVRLTETATGQLVTLGSPIVEFPGHRQQRFPVMQRLAPATAHTITVSEFGQTVRTSSFTTGAADDVVPPPAVTISGLAISRARYVEGQISSCGNEVSQVEAVVENLSPEASALRVRITHDGVAQERTLKAESWALRTLGVQACNVLVDLEPGATYEVAVMVRDLAGNESATYETTVEVRACAPIDFRVPVDLRTCPLEGSDSSAGCRTAEPAGSLAIVCVLGALARRRRRPGSQ